MNKITITKLKMYQLVLEVSKAHQSSWSGIPGFVSAVSEFENKLNEMRDDAWIQENGLHNVTLIKDQKLNELYDALFLAHATLAIFGKDSGNKELQMRNKFSRTELSRFNITRLSLHLDAVSADLASFGSQLEIYGISPAILQATIMLIEEGRASSISPRQAMNERKMLTSGLDKQMRELDEILKFRLDKLMRLFRNTNKKFYNRYFNARVIIDAPHKKSNLEGPPKNVPPNPDDGLY
jgi:hypothetical protein